LCSTSFKMKIQYVTVPWKMKIHFFLFICTLKKRKRKKRHNWYLHTKISAFPNSLITKYRYRSGDEGQGPFFPRPDLSSNWARCVCSFFYHPIDLVLWFLSSSWSSPVVFVVQLIWLCWDGCFKRWSGCDGMDVLNVDLVVLGWML